MRSLQEPKHPQGSIVVLFAVLLPIIIMIFIWAINLGILAIRKAQLRNAADLASQAGAGVISQLIIAKAQSHNPPPAASNPLIYLTDNDRSTIANDLAVKFIVEDYLEKNWPAENPQVDFPNSQIEYPANIVNCNGSLEQKSIDLKVDLSVTSKSLFAQLISNSQLNTTQTKSVRICP